jgi:P3 major capsid protein
MANGNASNGMAANQLTPQQQNMIARQAVISQAVDMRLPIYSQSFSAANGQGPGTVINVPPRNVGLIKRFIVEVTGTITPAGTATITPIGGGGFFSQVVFTDLSNQQRISTTAWHLSVVSSAKRRRPYGAATAVDAPTPFATPPAREPNAFGFGNNTDCNSLPASISAATPFRLFFEIPLAYTDHDLRGSVYANVTNATMNIQLTVNSNLFTAPGAQNVNQGMYSSAGAMALTNFTITIYQNFLDQLPISQQGGPVLPLLDLSTAYLLNNTALSAIVSNQDNPITYANFRDFMSTAIIYNDPSSFTSTTSPINWWSLQSANYTNIFRVDPYMLGLLSREIIGTDFPLGMSYTDYRNRPVSTIQFGNMQLLMNPQTVTNNQTAMLIGYESLALINMITQAGSLYGT